MMNPKWTSLKALGQLVYNTIRACIHARVVSQGAALAYYTIFAIAPLFVITLGIAGFCFGEAAAKSRVGFLVTAAAAFTLAVASTAIFVQLQTSLNTLWGVLQVQGMAAVGIKKSRYRNEYRTVLNAIGTDRWAVHPTLKLVAVFSIHSLGQLSRGPTAAGTDSPKIAVS